MRHIGGWWSSSIEIAESSGILISCEHVSKKIGLTVDISALDDPKCDSHYVRVTLSNWACSLRVFICICPNIVRGILVTMWRYFSYHLVFWPKLWLTIKGQKQKFAVRLHSNFFSNFGHFSRPFNPVFYFHFKNIIFFKIGQKLTFLQCFFHGTIFLAEKFLLSWKMFNKMWIYCEMNSHVIWYCESQCERNSCHILTHILSELWGNCEWR